MELQRLLVPSALIMLFHLSGAQGISLWTPAGLAAQDMGPETFLPWVRADFIMTKWHTGKMTAYYQSLVASVWACGSLALGEASHHTRGTLKHHSGEFPVERSRGPCPPAVANLPATGMVMSCWERGSSGPLRPSGDAAAIPLRAQSQGQQPSCP